MKNFEKHIFSKIEAGRTIEAVRQIIKTGQYAEQDRRESLKETFKPITDELEKVDEGIDELKKELKAERGAKLKSIGGPPALPAIERSSQATITDKDYLSIEEQESLMERGYRGPKEMIDNPDLREETLEKLKTESKSLGGQKRNAKGNKKKDIEKKTKG